MVLSKVHISNLGENLSVTLNYLLTFSSAHHACSLTLCNEEDHRGIEKIVEVKGCHVSLFPLPTLGISGRDSCKGGRFVTAQIWYPKIWANFFTFCFALHHGILFKLLKLDKATHGKLKQGKQTLPKFQNKCNCSIWQNKIFLSLHICPGSSKNAIHNDLGKVKFHQTIT